MGNKCQDLIFKVLFAKRAFLLAKRTIEILSFDFYQFLDVENFRLFIFSL
jgi:hypothetical protein